MLYEYGVFDSLHISLAGSQLLCAFLLASFDHSELLSARIAFSSNSVLRIRSICCLFPCSEDFIFHTVCPFILFNIILVFNFFLFLVFTTSTISSSKVCVIVHLSCRCILFSILNRFSVLLVNARYFILQIYYTAFCNMLNTLQPCLHIRYQ